MSDKESKDTIDLKKVKELIELMKENDLVEIEVSAGHNKIQLKRRESIDKLGARLQNINMLLAPAVILLFSIGISIRRNVRKRHYISHASDA